MRHTPIKWEEVKLFTVRGTQVILQTANLQVVVDCGSADGVSLMLREWKRSGPLAFPPEFEVSISPLPGPSESFGK